MPRRSFGIDRLLATLGLALLARDAVLRIWSIGHASIWIDEWLQWMNAWRPAGRWWLGQGLGETLWIAPIRLIDLSPAVLVAGLRTWAFALSATAVILVVRQLRRCERTHGGWIALAASPWLLAHAATGRPFGPAIAGLAVLVVVGKPTGPGLFGTLLALLHPVTTAFLVGAAALQSSWRPLSRVFVAGAGLMTLGPTFWFLWAGRADYPPLAQAVLAESAAAPRWLTLDVPGLGLSLAALTTALLGIAALRVPELRRHGLAALGWLTLLALLSLAGAPMLARYLAPAFVWIWLSSAGALPLRLRRPVLGLMGLAAALSWSTPYRHPESAPRAAGIPIPPEGRPCRLTIDAASALGALSALDQLSSVDLWLPGADSPASRIPFDRRSARCAVVGTATVRELLTNGTLPKYSDYALNTLPLAIVGWREFRRVSAAPLYTWALEVAPPPRPESVP